MAESTAVAITTKQVGMVNPQETVAWAEVFRKSGLFSMEGNPETQLAQAQVKILAGAEMGLQPFFSMQNLYIVKGHVFVSAAAFGALVNGGGDAKFITKESNADKAVIEFWRKVDGKFELVHTQVYTWDDVPQNRRTQATYQSDRADMIWNRCMTKGAKKSVPEKVGGMKSVEEAQDEVEWREEPLIPETVQRATPPAAALADEAAKPAPEIAVSTPTTVAATSEKPKRKAKAQPVDPGPSDSEILDSAVPDDEGVIEHHSDEMPADADIADEPATRDQKDDMGFWMNSEKFDIAAAIKQHGWKVGQFGDITQAQYHELKADRDTYIKAAAAELGWNLEPNLATTAEQRKQLVARHQKSLPRA